MNSPALLDSSLSDSNFQLNETFTWKAETRVSKAKALDLCTKLVCFQFLPLFLQFLLATCSAVFFLMWFLHSSPFFTSTTTVLCVFLYVFIPCLWFDSIHCTIYSYKWQKHPDKKFFRANLTSSEGGVGMLTLI